MEELTKFVTGQFQKKMNEKSFKDILKSDEGEFDLIYAETPRYKNALTVASLIGVFLQRDCLSDTFTFKYRVVKFTNIVR